MVDAFRHGGGANKPVFLQVVLAYDPDEAQALQAAHDQWRQGALDSTQLATLSMPSEFDAAWLEENVALGCQAICLHHVGREVDRFIDVFGSEVLPALSGVKNMDMHDKDES